MKKKILLITFILAAAAAIAAIAYSEYLATKVPEWKMTGVIIHAGGQIDGIAYTNSKEALEASCSKKPQVIEMDYLYTSDEELVCSHGWVDKEDPAYADQWADESLAPTKKEFMSRKIKGKYTPMTADESIKILADSKKYLIVDTKSDKALSVYKDLIKSCDKQNLSWYKKMIIPQIYFVSEYDEYKDIYDFRYGVFSIYKQEDKDAEHVRKIAAFCAEKGLVIAIKFWRFDDKMAAAVKKENVKIAVYTVDSKKDKKSCMKKGADMIYTDTLY